jgi:hypothetical protein
MILTKRNRQGSNAGADAAMVDSGVTPFVGATAGEALMYSKEVRARQRAQAAQNEALDRYADQLKARDAWAAHALQGQAAVSKRCSRRWE